MSDPTQPKRVIGTPFKLGNPGRPKGSRNKLQEDFVRDFCEVWAEHGYEALLKVATQAPDKFVAVAASILPKEIKAEIEHRAVMRMPTKAQSADEWLMKTITESSGSLAPPRNTLS